MKVVSIFLDKVAETLATQALKDELNIEFGVDVNIYKEEEPGVIKEEYMDAFARQYDYFFEILTNADIHERDGEAYIIWTVEDFKDKAISKFEGIDLLSQEDIEELFKNRYIGNYQYKLLTSIKRACKNWSDLYDSSLFADALEKMVSAHNANEGITWDTVGEYLDSFCMKKVLDTVSKIPTENLDSK